MDPVIRLRLRSAYRGKLITGGYKLLSSGLDAIETRLGWTVMGKTGKVEYKKGTDLVVTAMMSREIAEADLWSLDVIGIKDQAEKQSRSELEERVKEHFLKTLTRLPDGRYEVALPWVSGLQPPSNNRVIAEARLHKTIKLLKTQKLLKYYEDVFKVWLREEIIEPVDVSKLVDPDSFKFLGRSE